MSYNKRTNVSFAPCHARTLAYTSSGRRRSAAAKLGWIIVGRRVVAVGPQTTRNGVVAIDRHTTRSGEAWDHGLAGTNDAISRFWHDALLRRRSQKHRERSKGIMPRQNALHLLQLI